MTAGQVTTFLIENVDSELFRLWVSLFMRILSRVPLSVSEDFFIRAKRITFCKGNSPVSDVGKSPGQKLTQNTSVPLF
jgi:hypothetical protein